MQIHYRAAVFLSFTVLSACSHSQDKVSIIPLTMLNYTDSSLDRGNLFVAKGEFYIVQGFKDNKETQNFIDSFVEKNKDPALNRYNQYDITFYKESSKTNIKNLLANPRDLDRYSQGNDRIYDYYWRGGTFMSRFKIRNGEIIEPKADIKIEDIPGSLDKKKQ